MSCHDEEDARREAAEHEIGSDEAARLSGLCMRKFKELGNAGVRGHSVEFPVTAWHSLPGMPDSILSRGRISRGDVLDIGEQARAEKLSPVVLLATSFAWGYGMTGYGPRRYRDIIDAAGSRLEPALRQALRATVRDPRSPTPSQGMPSYTEDAILISGHKQACSRGPGCTGSARPSSPSFSTSRSLAR